MSMSYFLRIFTVFVVVGLGSQSMAQSSLRDGYVDTKFRTLAWKPINGSEIFYESDGQLFDLSDMSAVRRSEGYSYVGPRQLTFFSKNQDENGMEVRQTIGQIQLDQSMKLPLLIFLEKPEGGYFIAAIEDHPSSFPFGSYRFFNFTSKKLGVKLGDEKEVLEPRLSTTIDLSKAERPHIGIRIVEFDGGQSKRVFSSGFPHNQRNRRLVFITEVPRGDRKVVQIKSLPEFPEALEAVQ